MHSDKLQGLTYHKGETFEYNAKLERENTNDVTINNI
jgi:hypothetical protein